MCLVTQSCPSLCDPLDGSLPSSSVHGIFSARILEGVPFPTPENLPNQGIKLASLAPPELQVDSLPVYHLGSPILLIS